MTEVTPIGHVEALQQSEGWRILCEKMDDMIQSELDAEVLKGIGDHNSFITWRTRMLTIQGIKELPDRLIEDAKPKQEEIRDNDPYD